jgi:hypothetical protein
MIAARLPPAAIMSWLFLLGYFSWVIRALDRRVAEYGALSHADDQRP